MNLIIPKLTKEQINDLRSKAKNMYGAERRSFQAEITLQYCHGSARKAEKVFGWGRRTIKIGLAEKKTGVVCVGAQSAFCGSKIWEKRYPDTAKKLYQLIGISHPENTNSPLEFFPNRLTPRNLLNYLKKVVPAEHLPSLSTMDNILIRIGYRPQRLKSGSQQKIKETAPALASAENVQSHPEKIIQ